MHLDLLERAPVRYAYLRHLGPYHEIGDTFGRMAGIAGRAGLLGGPDALFIGVYHDDPSKTPAAELTSDAGVTVAEGSPIPEGLEEGHLPGGPYIKGVHKGSYAKMSESWMAFWDTAMAQGYRPRPVSPFELYISDMDTTPEEELITELYAAVEPR